MTVCLATSRFTNLRPGGARCPRALRPFLALCLALMPGALWLGAQAPPTQPKPSQLASVTQQIADTKLTITYSRPVARGRELFGKLVPYGKIWNPGANDATSIIISTPITVNGQKLAAGSYSIWANPGPAEWTWIFSKAYPVFHLPYPGEDKDALRLTIKPRSAEHMETLAIYFPVVDGRKAEMVLHWGTVAVPLEIVVP